MTETWPEAHPGAVLTAEMWNAAKRASRRNRIIPGRNILIHETDKGTIVHAVIARQSWAHPFRVQITATTATILPGWINGALEPEIDQTPLSTTPPPVLNFKKLKLDKTGRGYIAIEVRFNEKWEFPEHSATVIQCARFDSLDETEPGSDSSQVSGTGGVPILQGRIARWPLAMIVQRKTGALDLFQITHGDLQARPQPRDLSLETGRVFFW